MRHSLLKGVHLCVQVCTHTCVCACVFTMCNTEVIIHAVACHVDVSSDGEAVCSLLAIASLSTFLRNREYDCNNKRTITIFQYKSVYILYRFYACCTGIPNGSLLQNGCCNMAAINITHFTTLQLNLKSHVAQYLTSPAINSNTTSHLATLM